MTTPIAYYDAQGNPRDARGAIIMYINPPVGDVVGVMDGYEDDIETIYLKGNPIPQWEPLGVNNSQSNFGVGLGLFSFDIDWDGLFKNYWFLILALMLFTGAMMTKGRA